MRNKTRSFWQSFFIILFSVLIPFLLILHAFQAQRYTKVYKEVRSSEKKQEQLIEENKKIISDISLVSNSDEIEKRASEELNMHKAEKEDIIRVELSSKK